MNHVVAVHASTTRCASVPVPGRIIWCEEGKGSSRSSDRGTRSIGDDTVVRTIVTFVTQEGGDRFQQRREVGTVRRMAIGAVFGHRLMFPEEGAAFFRMASVASLNDRIFLKQFGSGRAMGIVAI